MADSEDAEVEVVSAGCTGPGCSVGVVFEEDEAVEGMSLGSCEDVFSAGPESVSVAFEGVREADVPAAAPAAGLAKLIESLGFHVWSFGKVVPGEVCLAWPDTADGVGAADLGLDWTCGLGTNWVAFGLPTFAYRLTVLLSKGCAGPLTALAAARLSIVTCFEEILVEEVASIGPFRQTPVLWRDSVINGTVGKCRRNSLAQVGGSSRRFETCMSMSFRPGHLIYAVVHCDH